MAKQQAWLESGGTNPNEQGRKRTLKAFLDVKSWRSMAEHRLPFAEIRRRFGAPLIQVDVAGRIWKLHLVDGQHDSPTVELVFEHVEAGLPAVRVLVDDSNLDRDHVVPLLRRHLTENPPPSTLRTFG